MKATARALSSTHTKGSVSSPGHISRGQQDQSVGNTDHCLESESGQIIEVYTDRLLSPQVSPLNSSVQFRGWGVCFMSSTCNIHTP